MPPSSGRRRSTPLSWPRRRGTIRSCSRRSPPCSAKPTATTLRSPAWWRPVWPLRPRRSRRRSASVPTHKLVLLPRAEPLLRDALALRRRTLGDGHPDVAASREHLGLLLIDRGAYTEAEAELRQALAAQRRAFGSQHPEVGRTLNDLGIALYYQGAEPRSRCGPAPSASPPPRAPRGPPAPPPPRRRGCRWEETARGSRNNRRSREERPAGMPRSRRRSKPPARTNTDDALVGVPDGPCSSLRSLPKAPLRDRLYTFFSR